jgi:hypothetical protein
MAHGGTIDAFIDTVFNFPTLSESFKYAAYDGLQRLERRSRPSDGAARATRCDPATRSYFAGVDLSRPGLVAGRPSTVCVMDRWRRCRFSTWAYEESGAGILPEDVEAMGSVLAVGCSEDVPEGLLAGLRRRGRGIVGETTEDCVDVLLVRPTDLWQAWAQMGRTKRPASPSARRLRYDILRAESLEFPVGPDAIHDDQLDAAAAAYAAYLWATKQASADGAYVKVTSRT